MLLKKRIRMVVEPVGLFVASVTFASSARVENPCHGRRHSRHGFSTRACDTEDRAAPRPCAIHAALSETLSSRDAAFVRRIPSSTLTVGFHPSTVFAFTLA